jgi:hypothetical protein
MLSSSKHGVGGSTGREADSRPNRHAGKPLSTTTGVLVQWPLGVR